MNKPKFTGDDGRSDDKQSDAAKWASLVAAMRESDPLGDPHPGTDADAVAATSPATDSDSASFTGFASGDPALAMTDEDMNESGENTLLQTLGIIVLASIWILFAGGSVLSTPGAVSGVEILMLGAAIVTPLLLLIAIWMIARRPNDSSRRWSRYALQASEQANRSFDHLAQAEERLHQAYATLEERSRNASVVAESSAEALLATARRIEEQSAVAEGALRSSGSAAAETLALVRGLEESAPALDTHLAGLSRTLSQSGADLARTGATLDEQLRSAAIVAEEARVQLTQAHESTISQIAVLHRSSRETGDELTAMAELASARVELVMERARTAMTQAREGLEEHRASLEALSDQGERSAAHVEALGPVVTAIGERLAALEQEAEGRQIRMRGSLGNLSSEAERLGLALDRNNDGSAQLIARMETLLLALDSNIREFDESLPAALGRFDHRLAFTETKLGETASLAETLAGKADAAARHLEQAGEALVAQSQVVEATISAGDASLARHTAEIATMRSALEESAALLARMIESAAPRLAETLEKVREQSQGAVRHAEQAIDAVVARTADALAQGSGAALDHAVSEKVNAQIAQIAEIADNAVKSAHRATDHLMREMMAIADTATDLEDRMARARQVEETRSRDHLTERSAQIIAALNDSAIDVAKWLSQDIGQKEWASYLSGDKSLFARRAVRLLGSGDMKQIHTRYEIDGTFREHVNRYVEDFEAMLAEVLGGSRGHSLAIALLSSDLGKLYVALAQAIERLRVS